MKKILLIAICFTLIASCSNYEDYTLNDEAYQDDIQLRMAADGEWDVLGFGYDVMGEYLAPTSIKDAVIDMKLLLNDPKARKPYSNASTSGYNKFTYGVNASDYLKELTKEENISLTAGYMAFSGTISMNKYLKTSDSYSSKYSFASCDVTKNVKRIYINAYSSELLDYLNPDFKKDIQNLSADRIIERYGTHVLTDFTIGGRLNLIYKSIVTSSTSSEHKKESVKAGINATVSVMKIGIDGGISNESLNTLSKNNTNRELYVEYYGGEGAGMSYNLETGTPTINVHQWESTVNAKNAALTKVNWSKAYPIWEFVTDASKKAAIKTAVEKYIKVKEINQTNVLPFSPYGMINNLRGYIFEEYISGGVPLIELVGKKGRANHLYTTNPNDIGKTYEGYEAGKRIGYVYTSSQPNTVKESLKTVGATTISVYILKP